MNHRKQYVFKTLFTQIVHFKYTKSKQYWQSDRVNCANFNQFLKIEFSAACVLDENESFQTIFLFTTWLVRCWTTRTPKMNNIHYIHGRVNCANFDQYFRLSVRRKRMNVNNFFFATWFVRL